VRLFASLLIEMVTVAVAPTAKVSPAEDSVTHGCVLLAAQLREALPVFVSVYETLGGLNGLLTGPEKVSPPAGDTDNTPVPVVTPALPPPPPPPPQATRNEQKTTKINPSRM
jgi:hypothetical protein